MLFFKNHNTDDADSSTLSDTIQNDDACLDIINDMKFDIGVQSFSQINRVINFHVDMKLPKTKQMQAEQSLLDEIKFLSQNKDATVVPNIDK